MYPVGWDNAANIDLGWGIGTGDGPRLSIDAVTIAKPIVRKPPAPVIGCPLTFGIVIIGAMPLLCTHGYYYAAQISASPMP